MHVTRLDPKTPPWTRYPENEDKRRRRPPTKDGRPRTDEVELSDGQPEPVTKLVYGPGR